MPIRSIGGGGEEAFELEKFPFIPKRALTSKQKKKSGEKVGEPISRAN
jgi:hypothetical protein